MLKNRKELYEREPLLPEVLEFAVAAQIISVTSIQRRFRIGYPRAVRLLDVLVEEGFVEEEGGAPRKVLLSQEQYINLYGAFTYKFKEEEYQTTSPRPKKGDVSLEQLKLDDVKFFDEFGVSVDEACANQLKEMMIDILCKDTLVSLSSDFLFEFLNNKKYNVKYIKLDFGDSDEISNIIDKITSPVIYILDVADGSVMEILRQCNLLVKEGAVVMRKAGGEKSSLTILY